jgi:hypothetical protein
MRSLRRKLKYTAVVAAGITGFTIAGGSAAFADSAQSVTPNNGGSSTNYQLAPPSTAKCSGDTASGQYQIFTYIIPHGANENGTIVSEDPTSLRFVGGSLTDADGQYLPMFDQLGNPISPYATGVASGSVSEPPLAGWSAFLGGAFNNGPGSSLYPGTYDVGIMCLDTSSVTNPSGVPDIPGNGVTGQNGGSNFWNAQFTFTPLSGNPLDFTWTASVTPPNQTPEAPLAIALPLSFIALAGAGAVVLRRRRHTSTANA